VGIRARRKQTSLPAEAMRWAAGDDLDLDERAGLQFFTDHAHLEAAFLAVNGESIAGWLMRQPDLWRTGPVEWNGLVLVYLDRSAIELLRAGEAVAPDFLA
jgi:hypothetical protein